MKNSYVSGLIALSLMVAGSAFANETAVTQPAVAEPVAVAKPVEKAHKHAISKRIARQEKRIAKGVKSGKLTSDQAAQLTQKEEAIKQEGTMTKAERKNVRKELNQQSKEIRKAKNPSSN